MDSVPVPSADDHCRITVVVKQLGQRSPANFNRLLERLQRVCTLQVSDSPRRVIIANIVPSVNANVTGFSELQAHRRVVGLIGIVQASANEDQPSTSGQASSCESLNGVDTDGSTLQPRISRRYSSVCATLPQVKEQYDAMKFFQEDYSATLVDSRCIAFGFEDQEFEDLWPPRELLSFRSLEESDKLENGVREFFRSIFFVLESKRLDVSFEKLDPAPCPCLPDEQKYRQGVENKTAKLHRKKCLGRLRKQVADYTLLTGLPLAALEVYQSSIENLKQANDFLWLAAAYEGWACAAMAVKYDFVGEYPPPSGMQRVSTMTPDQMRLAHQKNQRALGVTIGHQRYRSDVDRLSLLTPTQSDHLLTDDQQKRTFKLPWSFDRRSGAALDLAEIVEKFRLALENYERFSHVAYIEYECVMKAVSLFRLQRQYIEMECFLRDHIAKYLDDNFTFFDRYMKSMICLHAALIFRSVGFKRKDAFFSRLAGLFRLHVEGTNRTFADYRVVYPLFFRTLAAYGISENPRDVPGDLLGSGPVQLQKKVLYEVFMSALRAEHYDAAVRHLCYLLQVYYEYMDTEYAMRMFEELGRLVKSRTTVHQLNQHLTIPQCDIIVPPVQMTRFPRFEKFAVSPLPPHLSPIVVRPKPKADVFIYSPFQHNDANEKAINWVVDCVCEVSVSVSNCLPFELSVHHLSLLTDGCAFEAVPVELTLASSENADAVDIKLLGVPKAAGTVTITGYSCEVFGVRNVCRLRDLPSSSRLSGENSYSSVFSVKVLPALPTLTLLSSLPRAPISDSNLEPAAETTVYSGQTFEHAIEIVNSSETIAIHDVQLEILQPKVSGGPCLIELVGNKSGPAHEPAAASTQSQKVAARLEPKERKTIRFRIFGIDPAAAADDAAMSKALDAEGKAEGCEGVPEGAQDRIPFTGRLLMSAFVFRYKADVERPSGEEYERCCRLPLAVTVLPAVTVAAWHVLPGEGPSSRYVVVDVTNSTEWDAELNYGGGKMIGVQPKELCRVPLLCECCSEVTPSAFRLAASKASYMMQMQEMERLRLVLEKHVSALLDIRWTISAMSLEGSVPVGPILSSISLLKQLVVPSLSIETKVNDVLCLNEEDIVVGIGEVVDLEVGLISSASEGRVFKGVIKLDCYRDLMNGSSNINSNESMRILNTEVAPFTIYHKSKRKPGEGQSQNGGLQGDYSPCGDRHSHETEHGHATANFLVFFLSEGTYKVKPLLELSGEVSDFSDDELFCSAVTFNVITKVS